MTNDEQKINYITDIRQAASYLILGWEMLRNAGLHWTAEDLGNVLVDGDMDGTIHDGITMTHLSNIISSTLPMLNTEFITNYHQSNLYPLQMDLE